MIQGFIVVVWLYIGFSRANLLVNNGSAAGFESLDFEFGLTIELNAFEWKNFVFSTSSEDNLFLFLQRGTDPNDGAVRAFVNKNNLCTSNQFIQSSSNSEIIDIALRLQTVDSFFLCIYSERNVTLKFDVHLANISMVSSYLASIPISYNCNFLIF
jgi:hypothetical protein